MKELLSDKMLFEIFKALEKGESFEYSDDNTQISICPHSITIKCEQSKNEEEIEDFLRFCEELDDDLFVEVCESFEEGELKHLQETLDSPNYLDTIKTFTQRVKEIANNKLAEITNAAEAEMDRQMQIINAANKIISELKADLKTAYAKYTI